MWNQQVFTGSTFVNFPEPVALNLDLSIRERCIPQILYTESSINQIGYLEVPEMSMDVISQEVQGNHTTTINVYKLNFEALIFTLTFFIIIVTVVTCLWKDKRIRTLKPPVPVIYYLSKTAYKREHADLCMSLIEKEDYDVNYTSSDVQLSSFLCACLSSNADLIAFMIKRGADVHGMSYSGDSAIYLAVYGLNSKASDFECLDLLLAAGCDINSQNNSGFTALHLACARGNLSLVQYLLGNGADASISNFDSILPYEIAISENHKEIANYLWIK